MSDEEKPLDLRDKLALEILNGLLANDPTYYSTNMGNVLGVGANIHHYHKSSFEPDKEKARLQAEELIRTAYMMADVMRKVRLTAFT